MLRPVVPCRMTFEWALIAGQNDDARTAHELGQLLQPLKGLCHVNTIPVRGSDSHHELLAFR